MKLARLPVLLLALLIGLSTTIYSASPALAAQSRVIKVLQANLDKNSAATFASKMYGPNYDVVLLQEVCDAQLNALRNEFGQYGWQFETHTFLASASNCGGGPSYLVVGSPWPMVIDPSAHIEMSPENSGEGIKYFKGFCAHISIPGQAWYALKACSTHLSTNPDSANVQAQKIKEAAAASIAAGQALIVGGDFNSLPNTLTMDKMYKISRQGGSGSGLFTEGDQTDSAQFNKAVTGISCTSVCRTGSHTHTDTAGVAVRKFDYTFYSHDKVQGGLAMEVFTNPTSRHTIVASQATLYLTL